MNRIETVKHLRELRDIISTLYYTVSDSEDGLITFLNQQYLRLETVTDVSAEQCKEAVDLAQKLTQHVATLQKDAEERVDLPPVIGED